MANIFRDVCFKALVLKNATYENMTQGKILRQKFAASNPIVFSEWKPVGKSKVIIYL